MLNIKNLNHQASGNFFLMAGPCVVEGETICMEIAERIKSITDRLEIPYIFKASYRKANRSRIDSFTGIGDETALSIIKRVGEKYNLPTVTDIHESHEAAVAAQFVDVLQIPAFLCRQTDLLVAAAKTGKYVNIKKGQFLSGASMNHAVQKVRDAGNDNVILTDRGNTFGYQDLIVDYRNIPAMQQFNVPVVMDCTHSLAATQSGKWRNRWQARTYWHLLQKLQLPLVPMVFLLKRIPTLHMQNQMVLICWHLDNLEALLIQLIKIRKAIQ